MSQRDLHSNVKVVQLIDPIVGNNTAEGTPSAGLDTKGFDSAELIALLGDSGDTLSGSVYVEVIIEDSDDDTTYTAVTSSDFVIWQSDGVAAAPNGSGVVATIDAPAEDSRKIRVGYLGSKRYVQLKLAFTGTHTNGIPIAELGVLGNAHQRPTSDV